MLYSAMSGNTEILLRRNFHARHIFRYKLLGRYILFAYRGDSDVCMMVV
jgi:hypothetical protein